MGADHIRERFWLLAHADMRGELLGAINAKARLRSRVRPSVWDAKPDQCGVANGLANRLDRLKATGNGQIPSVAARAFVELASQFK